MTDAENLVLRNLLNGVEPVHAGRAAGLSEDEVGALFTEAMRHVGEYALVHCVPLGECQNLPAARRNRRAVLNAIAAIARWDDGERELAIGMLMGRNVIRDGVSRESAEALLGRVLEALPHYLSENHIGAFHADRVAFVREHRSTCIAALERFVSFREPFLYTKITHVSITPGSAGLPVV